MYNTHPPIGQIREISLLANLGLMEHIQDVNQKGAQWTEYDSETSVSLPNMRLKVWMEFGDKEYMHVNL